MAPLNAVMIKLLIRLRASERGASLVEYTLLIALIALVCVSAVGVMGKATGSSFSNSGTSMFGP